MSDVSAANCSKCPSRRDVLRRFYFRDLHNGTVPSYKNTDGDFVFYPMDWQNLEGGLNALIDQLLRREKTEDELYAIIDKLKARLRSIGQSATEDL